MHFFVPNCAYGRKRLTAIMPDRGLAFDPLLLEARQDLASRHHVAEWVIRLLSALARTWNDASRGCPIAGRAYELRNSNGHALRQRHGSRDFPHHTDLTGTISYPAITDN